jgi:hypothetical protein
MRTSRIPSFDLLISHMLLLKQSLRCRLLGVRGVKSWHKDLDAPLKRVGARIDAALQVQFFTRNRVPAFYLL